MRLIVYPSLKRPQFYLSDKPAVIDYFIDKFFYFRKRELQLALSVLKRALPNSLVRLLVVLAAGKDTRLPSDLSSFIHNAVDVIKKNKGTFQPGREHLDELSYIIRKSKWHRDHDKVVVLFFVEGSSKPFTVMKLGAPGSGEVIQNEYNNSKLVYGKFRDSTTVAIPEPVAISATDNITVYAERVLDGIPFNDYQKRFIRKKSVLHLHREVMDTCRNFLLELHAENHSFTEREFSKYFYIPLDTIMHSDFGKRHAAPLKALKTSLYTLEDSGFPTVWMHGDFWHGSVLYDAGKTGFIDWELFTERGVPLWDYFSLIFHIGVGVRYFDDVILSKIADNHLLGLAQQCRINRAWITLLFQSFLIFNVQERDREGENYWQTLLEYYWTVYRSSAKGFDCIL